MGIDYEINDLYERMKTIENNVKVINDKIIETEEKINKTESKVKNKKIIKIIKISIPIIMVFLTAFNIHISNAEKTQSDIVGVGFYQNLNAYELLTYYFHNKGGFEEEFTFNIIFSDNTSIYEFWFEDPKPANVNYTYSGRNNHKCQITIPKVFANDHYILNFDVRNDDFKENYNLIIEPEIRSAKIKRRCCHF
jgi:hypothetical protein